MPPRRRPRHQVREALSLLTAGRRPFLSVYLDVTTDQARSTASQRLDQAACALPGVTPSQRMALGLDLAQHQLGPHDATLAALLDADGNRVVTTYPLPPHRDVIELANLPYLGPMLYAEQALVHHVVALVQGSRLDILTVPRHGDPVSVTLAVDNARAVGIALRDISRSSRTRFLLLGAAGNELETVADHVRSNLPMETELHPFALDALDDHGLISTIDRATATHAASLTVELLRLWRFHYSQDEAVTGTVPSIEALRSGRAALLLVHDSPDDERRAWFGADPHRIALDLDPAAPIVDGERLARARLTDVVIRSALRVGCPVEIVPHVDTLIDGIGVILNQRASQEGLSELLES